MNVWISVLIRSVFAVLIGGIIGSERARHGRAAGLRTHILVCLGSALTSMTSMYVSNVLGNNGDVFRISAQVISGVGFLGAGMIILKNNSTITGLTTAAGVWTTGAIGVAIGYGFFPGAIIVSLLFFITIVLLAKVEKKKRSIEVIYIEIQNINRTNAIINELKSLFNEQFSYQITPPKSDFQGNIGLILTFSNKLDCPFENILDIEDIVLVAEDS